MEDAVKELSFSESLGDNDIFICSRSTINLTLNLYYCGSEELSSGKRWGPKVVDHFILYYLYDGKGKLSVKGNTYEIQQGQGFLVPKNALTTFEANIKEPMKVAWVGFYGYRAAEYLKRASLSEEHPVFTYKKDSFLFNCYRDMIEASKLKYNRYCKLMSTLYLMLSELIDISDNYETSIPGRDAVEMYLRKALQYIEARYSEKLTVQNMAEYVEIDRKYLHRIFKENLGKSPQNYLIEYRMNKAIGLMKNHELTISNIANSVGYEDPFHFSKIFKKVKGMTPTEYRQNKIQNSSDHEEGLSGFDKQRQDMGVSP